MVLVRFEYLRSDSERKLLIGQFDLTHVKFAFNHEASPFFRACLFFKRSLVSVMRLQEDGGAKSKEIWTILSHWNMQYRSKGLQHLHEHACKMRVV